MPCFSSGPEPNTPEYAAWLPEVQRKLAAFTHVVDYYYRKAGLTMPDAEPSATFQPAGDPVLHQILLHLDCDGVDVFHLNDIRNLLREDRTPKGREYARALGYCFRALRNHFHDRPTTGRMWKECHDPELMLDYLRGQVSERKLRLFGVACCRRVPHLLTGRRKQRAVEVAERFADGAATVEDLAAAALEMRLERYIDGHYGPVAGWVVAPSAERAARETAWNAFCDRDGMGEERHQADLLRCVVGNPFQHATIDPALLDWRHGTIRQLAQAAYHDRELPGSPLDAKRVTILADALEEAGCTSDDVLGHLRGPGPHVRGCWVVDLLLGNG